MKTLLLTLALLIQNGAPPDRLGIEIPMRDGKSLAADVFPSRSPGRFPAILIQTPYDRKHFRSVMKGARTGRVSEVGRGAMSDMRAMVDREHYAYVVVDWRGFFGSKGAMKGVNRRRRRLGQDGYDCVEWVAKQDWCNGKVGTWGGSALGKVQFQTAAEQPPHLVCAVPMIAAMGQRYEFYYDGGLWREAHNRTLDALGFGVSRKVEGIPRPGRLWDAIRERTFTPEKIRVPCLMITGWWDHFPDEILETFAGIVAKGGPAAREHSKLLIGPWDHVSVGLEVQGDRKFGSAALASAVAARAFFDHWLLGRKNGWEKTARVRYFRVNEEKWFEAESFTGVEREQTTWHLDRRGRIGPRPGSGKRSYTCDPKRPSPTLGGANLPPLKHGPTVQDALGKREDVLVYDTGPLEKPLRIHGTVTLSFDFTASRESCDLIARLCEVRDGKAYLIADAATRERDLTPGKPRRATLKFSSIALTAGELRIYLSSTNWPRYGRNPHTGADHWDPKTARTAEITIHHEKAELILPLLPE